MMQPCPHVAGVALVMADTQHTEQKHSGRTKVWGLAAVILAAAVFAGPAVADTLQDQYSDCLIRYSDEAQTGDVMLQCNAEDGRLIGCRVTNAPVPTRGLDKAALCVASHIPVGQREGEVRVPIRFKGD